MVLKLCQKNKFNFHRILYIAISQKKVLSLQKKKAWFSEKEITFSLRKPKLVSQKRKQYKREKRKQPKSLTQSLIDLELSEVHESFFALPL